MAAKSTKENNESTMIQYLALGDSYTIGERVADDDRWSVQLTHLLRQDGVEMANPRIIARTGWTTAELMEGIREQSPPASFDLVSLLIGVNNQYRGQPTAQYRDEFRELLHQAIVFARHNKRRVFVLSIPDWSVTPFADDRDRVQIGQEIDAFNEIARQECTALNIVFIDVTALSRTALGDPSLIADDNLHFSGKMYALWAEKAQGIVKALLL